MDSESQQVGLFKVLLREVERAIQTDKRSTHFPSSSMSDPKRQDIANETLNQLSVDGHEKLG